jgi:hypothetical protein
MIGKPISQRSRETADHRRDLPKDGNDRDQIPVLPYIGYRKVFCSAKT